MLTNDLKMKIALAQMARASKTNWDQFLAEYRVYCDKITDELVSSPQDTLELAQGRARHAREVLKIFEMCFKDADQAQNRKQ